MDLGLIVTTLFFGAWLVAWIWAWRGRGVGSKEKAGRRRPVLR